MSCIQFDPCHTRPPQTLVKLRAELAGGAGATRPAGGLGLAPGLKFFYAIL